MSDRLRPKTAIRRVIPVKRVPAPSIAPQLLWPSIRYGYGIESHDVPHFPCPDNVHARHQAIGRGAELGLRAFEDAVAEAELHVLVLDQHFDKQGADILGGALISSQACDVRLLTGRRRLLPADEVELERMLTESCNEQRYDDLQVEVRWSATLGTDEFPFLHDRFAIIDGALWHFGATVGGGHPSLTAVSGPWSAEETQAVTFFEECWRRCNA